MGRLDTAVEVLSLVMMLLALLSIPVALIDMDLLVWIAVAMGLNTILLALVGLIALATGERW